MGERSASDTTRVVGSYMTEQQIGKDDVRV